MITIRLATQTIMISPARTIPYLRFRANVKPLWTQVSNYHQCCPYQRDDIQESIHDGDQDNYSAKPNMDSIVFRHNASLPILSMIEKAERILAEEEGCE